MRVRFHIIHIYIEREGGRQGGREGESAREQVLVIDDEPITVKIGKHALEKSGFQACPSAPRAPAQQRLPQRACKHVLYALLT
jgi:CheY-like chemotaxis protein